MWKRDELPFSIAETNEQLRENIRAFNEQSYFAGLKEFFHYISLVEDGFASKRVADVILGFMCRDC